MYFRYVGRKMALSTYPSRKCMWPSTTKYFSPFFSYIAPPALDDWSGDLRHEPVAPQAPIQIGTSRCIRCAQMTAAQGLGACAPPLDITPRRPRRQVLRG